MQAIDSSQILSKCLLLSKANWSYKDIQVFFGFGVNKAISIKESARKANGGFPTFDRSLVTISSVFELCGTTVDGELQKLQKIFEIIQRGNENGEQE